MAAAENMIDVEERYSIKQVSEMLDGLPFHTIRYWIDEIGIPVERDEMNNRWFTKDNVDLLVMAKEAKSQGANLKTIRKMFVVNGRIPENVEPNKFETSIVSTKDENKKNREEALAIFLQDNLRGFLSDILAEKHSELVSDLKEQFNKTLEKALEEQKASFLELVKGLDENVAQKINETMKVSAKKQIEELDKKIEQRNDQMVSQIAEYVRKEPEQKENKKWYQFWK